MQPSLLVTTAMHLGAGVEKIVGASSESTPVLVQPSPPPKNPELMPPGMFVCQATPSDVSCLLLQTAQIGHSNIALVSINHHQPVSHLGSNNLPQIVQGCGCPIIVAEL